MLVRRSNSGSVLLRMHRVFIKAAKASSSNCSIEKVHVYLSQVLSPVRVGSGP